MKIVDVDPPGRFVDVNREALHARVVVDHAAAGAAVGERPPLVAIGVVVDVGKEAEPSGVRLGVAGGIERVAGDDQAVDERRLRQRRQRGREQDGSETQAQRNASHRDGSSEGCGCRQQTAERYLSDVTVV